MTILRSFCAPFECCSRGFGGAQTTYQGGVDQAIADLGAAGGR